jgi:hypothetical protein
MKMSAELKELYDYADAVRQHPKEGDVSTLAFCLMALIRVVSEMQNASEEDDGGTEPKHDQDAAIGRVKFEGYKKALTELGLLRKPTP